jgi:hypothetical protein
VPDPTNTDAQHPAIVTVTGVPAPPAPGATGTNDQHPAVATRPRAAKPPVSTYPLVAAASRRRSGTLPDSTYQR